MAVTSIVLGLLGRHMTRIQSVPDTSRSRQRHSTSESLEYNMSAALNSERPYEMAGRQKKLLLEIFCICFCVMESRISIGLLLSHGLYKSIIPDTTQAVTCDIGKCSQSNGYRAKRATPTNENDEPKELQAKGTRRAIHGRLIASKRPYLPLRSMTGAAFGSALSKLPCANSLFDDRLTMGPLALLPSITPLPTMSFPCE